ncbi:MAG: aminopeptidase P N-terminal domain-containing protein [Rickettsiella sp.]|nr:aminopeptidase P N-terminal domain-containing protein [Rickettsiella sp.]
MSNRDELKFRRCQLLSQVDKDAVIVLISAPECLRNGDVNYPYRQNSDFYYLTGFPEPNSIALLLPDRYEGKFVLFNRPYDSEEAIWNGQSIGQERAIKEYAADEAYSIDKLELLLPNYISANQSCYYLGSNNNSVLVKQINDILAKMNKLPQEGLLDLAYKLHELRLKKSPSELACMRQAALVSSDAHKRVMQSCHPGYYEYQLEAELLHTFYQRGCRATAYPSIVASGGNACILHYTDNNAVLTNGNLVLIDAGCEYQSYASDITRTFPVNGRFSAEQKAIYDIVFKAQKAVIDLIKPGLVWGNLQKVCIEIITEGLLDLGLLKGNLALLIEEKAYKKFYMHGCSHWLGLDVHDVGNYKQEGQWRLLETNMVFTVEPGIYITQGSGVDQKWWNIGVRIEDDVRVTEDGCEIFSHAVPKEINDIESLMCS